MANRGEIVDLLSGMALFADLARPQLEGVAHTLDEESFAEGQRILRQGFTGSNFYVIVDGEAAIRIDGQDRAKLARGDFFGEVSVLLGTPPTADVVALRTLRCLTLAGPDVEAFLLAYPRVMFRMLQAEARRLQATIQWQS
ncbi:MAG TPA: cyclic nucleotide-binding domain-containing protein [Actinomycetota bacterium]|nr:cyclic nucleotide-binding domain-containing protein [Actinomycetota bacterium]